MAALQEKDSTSNISPTSLNSFADSGNSGKHHQKSLKGTQKSQSIDDGVSNIGSQNAQESSAHASRRSLFQAVTGSPSAQLPLRSKDLTLSDETQHPGSSRYDRSRSRVEGTDSRSDSSGRTSKNSGGGGTETKDKIQTIRDPASRSTLAVAGHDQLITWRIAAVAELADVEELLYEYGTRFRSFHITALLAKLPVIDTSGGNSGVRVREIVR